MDLGHPSLTNECLESEARAQPSSHVGGGQKGKQQVAIKAELESSRQVAWTSVDLSNIEHRQTSLSLHKR